MKSESLGIIEPKFFKFEENFELESGKILKGFEIIYETYGELNKDKSNAVLICHALSGNHHAAGYSHDEQDKSGWWNELIGPNKAFDTNKYFIVSLITSEVVTVLLVQAQSIRKPLNPSVKFSAGHCKGLGQKPGSITFTLRFRFLGMR